MRVVYQDYDITNQVQVKDCIVTDTCGSRCDSLDITFENAAGWYRWGPKEDDRIVVYRGKYDTGTMYVNTVLPEGGKYRIYATTLPCSARRKGYKSFANKTIEEIMRECAMETGMDYKIYGIDGDIVVPYIQKNNEGCAAFLCRLLMLEGAALKCVNGKYTAIGINYAQERNAYKGFSINSDTPNVFYTRSGVALKALTVTTPYATATAEDTAIDSSHVRTEINLPASDNVQAGRWARNKLLNINRQTERVSLQADFDDLITAMMRLDITGNTDAAGEWIVDKAQHDLINGKTSVEALRVVRTIQ